VARRITSRPSGWWLRATVTRVISWTAGEPLRVERAAPVDVAVLAHARERRQSPRPPVGGDDVEMREQDDRSARARAGEARVEVPAAGRGFEHLARDAGRLELPRERVRGGGLTAGGFCVSIG
jgi:hypothetical protein